MRSAEPAIALQLQSKHLLGRVASVVWHSPPEPK